MILTVTLNTAIDKLYVVNEYETYEVMRVQEVVNTAGGKGLNVSRVSALAGQDVIAMGFVGGYNGMLFESLITESAITKAFTKTAGNTRCCINARDVKANKSTEFLEPGCPVTAEEIDAFVAEFQAQLPKADVVTISGSMPQGVPSDFYGKLITLAKQAGKPVILDTSGVTLTASVDAKPTMIKPNTDEIRQILNVDINSREELIAAAKQLHDSGIAVVAVSLGKEGVLVVCKDGVFQGITPDIPVVNTVGSGDSMVAGFAVSMAKGDSIQEAIAFAVGVSTANTQTKETGFFKQEDLKWILPQVAVKQLA